MMYLSLFYPLPVPLTGGILPIIPEIELLIACELGATDGEFISAFTAVEP
jgi:hypothetical protein